LSRAQRPPDAGSKNAFPLNDFRTLMAFLAVLAASPQAATCYAAMIKTPSSVALQIAR